ncbi:protein of unknown function [Taphrina deformans PYCC 5710]|uniref:Uncharacterized protein n=1 Tax=Taphrina deformans (strain PYCC 5710 / ATCC 11124 / CBS 356.35 / IMI 108563 / JCM 9778 / NBRC 8474) TaxID=1097556 RepID=R4XDX8_TAPDE|nr:protein of unknown function [Taphrina deformans PYCC 5710]|eukprot:CCG84076.1 protein of unknown function [Taphrina deformans PYCC 5710]
MAAAKTAPNSDDESLSALSEVDERFLEVPEKLLPDIGHTNKNARDRRASRGVGVDLKDKTHGRTALHKAAARGNIERMKDLVEIKGATIDITDNAGVTPLHDACVQGRLEAVKYLLGAGATVSPKDCEGDYPLLDAAQNDNSEICQVLLDAGANPMMQNTKGMSALSEAEEGPLKNILRQYSSKFDSPGQNRMRITDVLTIEKHSEERKPISSSSPQRLSDRVRPRSSQLNIDSHGARKVDINGRDQLHQYVLEGDDDLVEQFLEIQDCDFKDTYGDTPLHSAARAGNAHICGLLLQHGAKVTIKNAKGNTALHEASFTPSNKDVIAALLDAGASSLARNHENQLPATIAALELGTASPEYRLLDKIAEKERSKQEMKQKKRSLKRDRNGSLPNSTRSSPMNSPSILHDQATTPVQSHPQSTEMAQAIVPPRKRKSPVIPDESAEDVAEVSQTIPRATHMTDTSRKRRGLLTPDVSPQDIALTVATSAPPEILSHTKQISVAGGTTTQFLTEFRSKSTLSPIDSSIRGSPLPPPVSVPTTRDRAKSPLKQSVPLQAEVNAANPPTSPDSTRRHPDPSDAARHARPPSPKRHKRASQHGQQSSTDGSLSEGETVVPGGPGPVPGPGPGPGSGDAAVAAIARMEQSIVAVMEKQSDLLNAMLVSINALVAAQNK